MKNLTPFAFALSLAAGLIFQEAGAQMQDTSSVHFGETALAFAAGSIQKATPRDGIVNLVTGDNQTTGDRMILGRFDQLYLKLDNPAGVAVGDLYTVYRRVRKVFHPVTGAYLGFTTIRSAVVRITQADHALSTAEIVRSYGAVASGDPVMRFVDPVPVGDESSRPVNVDDISGMIVEIQADKTMTLVSQGDVVYVDHGSEDGLRPGDLMDIHRYSAGLPPRKIGQLKVLSTEDHTATAKIIKANTRVMKGDRFKLAGHMAPIIQPAEQRPSPSLSQAVPAQVEQRAADPVPADLMANKLKVQDASGQSRVNLGDMANLLRYDSGEAAIKPESYKVLDQLIEYLHASGDERLIRVEGHTDNVEIGPSLKSRYPSNWELSKARANGVVRYLVEKGGLDSARLTSVGYGDSRPAASNAVEEGRAKNRRVEILLYAPQAEPSASKPELPTHAQKPDAASSSLSARESQDAPPTASDPLNAADSGTLSVHDPAQVPATNGPGTLSLPDVSANPSPDSGMSQDPAGPSNPAGQ